MTVREIIAGALRSGSVMIACAMIAACSTSSMVVDDPATPRAGHAYLVRGLLEVFSLGLDDVTSQLRAGGVNAHTISGLQSGDLARTISAARRGGRLSEPIVLIGHSYGADNAIRIAHSLQRDSIPVDALVLIDPTTPPAVPANVRRCFNIYKSSPVTDWIPVLRGVAVRIEDPATELINLDLRTCEQAGSFAGIDHFDIEDSPAIHAMVLKEVLQQCPSRAAQIAESGGHVASSDQRSSGSIAQPAMGALDGNEDGGH